MRGGGAEERGDRRLREIEMSRSRSNTGAEVRIGGDQKPCDEIVKRLKVYLQEPSGKEGEQTRTRRHG